jgi:hypothetical protein
VWDVANIGFWFGSPLWLVACLSSLWLWGGARRNALGLLAAGALLLVSGTLFIHVAVINAYARMDNAYLSNGLLGGFLVIAGATVLVDCLMGYGVRGWLVLVLWVATFAFGFFGAPLLARVISFTDSTPVLFAALVLGAVLLYVLLRGYVGDVLIAVVLAGLCLIVVWLVYGAGTRAFIPVETIGGSDDYKPPLLDIKPYLACILFGTGLLITGHLIQPLGRSTQLARSGAEST